jgi:hypothetical protein
VRLLDLQQQPTEHLRLLKQAHLALLLVTLFGTLSLRESSALPLVQKVYPADHRDVLALAKRHACGENGVDDKRGHDVDGGVRNEDRP